MKKARLFTLFTAIAIFTLLLLGGCKQKETIESISIKDYDPSTTIETAVGEFNYEAYTLVVTYDSGRTEEIPLTAEMILEADSFKFYQIGEHEITVSYAKATCTLKVSIKRATFGEISFPENNVFTYDGKEHTVEVQGDIPTNAVVTYTGGNTFINAGSYDVTAIVSCEGYVTENLSTTVKIERAKYDMSSIRFDAKEVVYDGQPHSIEISGTLPEGVSAPTYTINGQTSTGAIDVDEYTVTATFANNNPNYEPIPSMQTTLKITPAEYLLEDIDIVFKREDGQVIDGAVKTYDRSSVVFDLNDYSKLSNNVSVSFSVYDQSGKLLSSSNKNTNIINVGVYTVKAEFIFADSKNYYPIEPIVSIFEVIHAEYKISDISFNSNYFKYDGTERSIVIDGNLPAGVSVSYEYYLDDTLLVDAEGKPVQSVTNAGEYTVKAIFSVADINFGQISPLTAKLKIDKIKIDLASLGVLDNPSVQYSGAPYEPKFVTWKALNGTDYDVLNYSEIKYYKLVGENEYVEMESGEIPTNVGSYRFVITISIADGYIANYVLNTGNTSQTFAIDFEIEKMMLSLPVISFEGSAVNVYSGEPYPVKFTHSHNPEHITIITEYFKLEGDKYVKLGEGEIPTTVGVYKFVVTARVNDEEKSVFENDQILTQSVFVFEIEHALVEVPEVDFTYAEEIEYDGAVHPVELTYTPESSLLDVRTAYYKLTGDNYVEMAEGELPTKAGSYKFVFTASINDDNYILDTNADNKTAIVHSVEYVIEKAVIEIPECSLNIGESVAYSGKDQAIHLYHNAEFALVDIRTQHMVIKDGVAVDTTSLLNVGDYQMVVTATLRDPENYVFESGNSVETITLPWKITKRVVGAPEINITTTETEIDYDSKGHTVEHEALETSLEYKVYTLYYKLVDEEYVQMGAYEVPTDAGKYKGVVVAELYDRNGCTFESGETILQWVHEFEIKPIEITVPVLTITQEGRVLYSGEEQPVNFTSSVVSPYITISYHYTRMQDGVEIEMDTQHPLHRGTYTGYITATINNPNCRFANGEETVRSEDFTYEIYIHEINISELGWCETFDANNMNILPEYSSGSPFCVFEEESYEEFKKYVTCSQYDYQLYYRDPYSSEWRRVDYIYEYGAGVYEATYTITVKNSSSCVLIHNSEEMTELRITVYFRHV